MVLWKNLSHKIGRQKEQTAKDWLIEQGLEVIEENYHCKGGEIDLIAIEKAPSEPILVFIEVKYRKTANYGEPEEFVTLRKQQRIQKCAQLFLMKTPNYQNTMLRFDVISITGNDKPVWIQNAF